MIYKNLIMMGLVMNAINGMADGVIVHRQTFIPPAFEDLHDAFMTPDKKEGYEKAIENYRHMTDVTCSKISYMSDGLKVTGFIVEPKDIPADAVLPVLLYCRGGSHNDGKITVMTVMKVLSFFARQGYIVLATQYRGNDGGEGTEDMIGSGDVEDVIHLIKLAQTLPHADTNNCFMMGYSRGGTVACMALRKKIPVRAAALCAGVFDYFMLEQKRPDLIPLLQSMIPCTAEEKQAAYTERSSVYWASEVEVPVLLLHGERDYVVHLEHSQEFAKQLDAAHKEYRLITYAETDHTLAQQRDEIHNDILAWFAAHR